MEGVERRDLITLFGAHPDVHGGLGDRGSELVHVRTLLLKELV